MPNAPITNVTFYFDPACPWTFIASQWIRKVANSTGISLEFKPFSLAIKNRGNEIPENYRAAMEVSLAMLRVMVKIRSEFEKSQANSLVSEIYLRFGTQFHLDGAAAATDLEGILADFGISDEIALARKDDSLDAAIEESMAEALALTGDDVGVPIIALNSADSRQGFFGPILCRVPDDTEAMELWTHFVGLSQLGCFFELKRKKISGPALS